MTINKLSGDKLARKHLFFLYQDFLELYEQLNNSLAHNTANDELKKQIKRQMDGAETIIRKAYKKSIERQTL